MSRLFKVVSSLLLVVIVVSMIVWWEYAKPDKPDIESTFYYMPDELKGKLYDSPKEAAIAFGRAIKGIEKDEIDFYDVHIASEDRAKHLIISPGIMSFKRINDRKSQMNITPFFIEKENSKFKLYVFGAVGISDIDHDKAKEFTFTQQIHELNYDYIVAKHKFSEMRCDFEFQIKENHSFICVKARD